MRKFETGATRDDDKDKLDFEGFFSPPVLQEFAHYMHKHRKQADGSLRASDNWQKGIPRIDYMKSGWRHFFDWWVGHRNDEPDMEAACALMFNLQGYMHEVLLGRDVGKDDSDYKIKIVPGSTGISWEGTPDDFGKVMEKMSPKIPVGTIKISVWDGTKYVDGGSPYIWNGHYKGGCCGKEQG